MKLWEKDTKTEESILNFTVGNDLSFDKLLAPFDIIGSMVHAIMLGKTGILTTQESASLIKELANYYPNVQKNSFQLNPADEDIHSHLEDYLISKLGDIGKKIHTARSRNDQVAFALQLFIKEKIRLLIMQVKELFDTIIQQAEKYQNCLLPGYTHTQVAMPSSVGLWLGAYAELLASDLLLTSGIVKIVDQSTLGSAAGYGSSFPIDRELTTQLADFDEILVSSVSAQLIRGKLESTVAFGLASFAGTLSRFTSDIILFMGQDMNFISFPDKLTTGSSIMPHKKNPDVLELIRAHCNLIAQLPAQLNAITSNLISGYHRDFQLTKEILFPGFEKLTQCISMTKLMVENMKFRDGILEDEKYKFIFSVELVNSKVMSGRSFRDAYREVVQEIESGEYRPVSGATYSHIGSIGNPALYRIQRKMDISLKGISIKPAESIFQELKRYDKEEYFSAR